MAPDCGSQWTIQSSTYQVRGLHLGGGFDAHYTSFEKCSDELLEFPGGFDTGRVAFGPSNQPRDVFDSPPPVDMSGFDSDLVGALVPSLGLLTGPSLDAEYCQKHGLTSLGEFLLLEMMKRGMVRLRLVAELIEDMRRDGVTDEELEPLFKSAEAYLRMWEKSERRGAALSK